MDMLIAYYGHVDEDGLLRPSSCLGGYQIDDLLELEKLTIFSLQLKLYIYSRSPVFLLGLINTQCTLDNSIFLSFFS